MAEPAVEELLGVEGLEQAGVQDVEHGDEQNDDGGRLLAQLPVGGEDREGGDIEGNAKYRDHQTAVASLLGSTSNIDDYICSRFSFVCFKVLFSIFLLFSSDSPKL